MMKTAIIIAAVMLTLLLQLVAAQSVPAFPQPPQHCFDSSKNFNERGLDCGGDCLPCGPADVQVEQGLPGSASPQPSEEAGGFLTTPAGVVVQVLLLIIAIVVLLIIIEHARKATRR